MNQGGGWTALCHSIESNENAMADLTRNGSAAVKALFKTSEPGGKPGGLLTENGFPDINNNGGNWAVHAAAAKLPTAQLVPTTGATQSLPGGSVQTWPAPGHPGAPTYWSETERVASFTDGAEVSDHIIAGTYHDGTGAGKITFAGGHSYSTSVPYSGNDESPYLRAFYNSLFFNGTAKPQLEFSAPTTYPQNGTSTIQAELKNIGGSTAVNVNNTTVVLEPGFSYVSTTSGPTPSVSGQTLTWPNLGNLPGGQTAVTLELAVAPSVSSTIGQKKIATVKAEYGDVFGEGFTGVFCRELTITPIPAPNVTKTPGKPGPRRCRSAGHMDDQLRKHRCGCPERRSGRRYAAPRLHLHIELLFAFTRRSDCDSGPAGQGSLECRHDCRERPECRHRDDHSQGGSSHQWQRGSAPADLHQHSQAERYRPRRPAVLGSGHGHRGRRARCPFTGQDRRQDLRPDPGNVTYTLKPGFNSGVQLQNVRVFDPAAHRRDFTADLDRPGRYLRSLRAARRRARHRFRPAGARYGDVGEQQLPQSGPVGHGHAERQEQHRRDDSISRSQLDRRE